MKRHQLFLTILLFLTVSIGYGQKSSIGYGQKSNEQLYDNQKASGQTPDASLLPSYGPVRGAEPPTARQNRSVCDCYEAPDASYTLAMGPNDDGSTGAIAIPFNFCLYGTNYTQFFINNNGNITFDNPYSTFSAVGFPSNSYVMVAPFWGDVDTRGGLGQVWYKVTPTAVYVNWVDVGYYNQHGDKLNTFQVIITEGTDPVVPNGNNIAFCYQDMQWTTGDASSGVNGFGGVPATVGVNKGNGIDFIQMGRFDQAGNAYDGPVGANDGIDWLDNQSLYFNTCSATNIDPIFDDLGLGAAGSGASGNCATDTVKICGDGDTLIFSPSFLAPENGQTVTVSANFYGMTNSSVINSYPGNPGSADIMIIGDASNAGYNTIDIIGTDDGSPVGSTTISIVVFVDTTVLSNLNPTILGDTLACNNTTLALDSAYIYDFYQWSIQPSDSTVYIDTSGEYYVTVESQNCFKSEIVNVTIVEDPVPEVAGMLFACPGDSTLITVDTVNSVGLPYDSLNWGNGLDTTSFYYATPGSYMLTVVDTNGCTGSTSYNISSSTPLDLTDNLIELCDTLAYQFLPSEFQGENGGSWVVLDSTPGSTTTFTPSTGINPLFEVDTGGYYVFEYTDPCGDKDTVEFNFKGTPSPMLLDTLVCSSPFSPVVLDPNVIDPTGSYTYSWDTGDTTQTITVTETGNYIVDVTNSCGTGTDTSTIALAWVNTPPDTTICGLSYQLPPGSVYSVQGGSWSYSGSGTLSFSPGQNVEEPMVTASNYGTYTLTFTENLCGNTSSLTVTFMRDAAVSISDDTLCIGTPLTLDAYQPQNSTYLWNTGETTSSITVSDSGMYQVVASNYCNVAVDSAYITAVLCDCNIPNVITPNGDGKNDTWFIDCVQYFPENNVKIFNRWGNLVFEMDSYDQSWTGTKDNGKAVTDGTYFYILTIPEIDEVHKGTVNVFRH